MSDQIFHPCRERTSRCMSATVRTSLVLSPYGDSTRTVPSFRFPISIFYALPYRPCPLISHEKLINAALLGIKHSLLCFLRHQECQRKLEHKLGLDSYLLKPVQRLTKYQLLLKVKVLWQLAHGGTAQYSTHPVINHIWNPFFHPHLSLSSAYHPSTESFSLPQ